MMELLSCNLSKVNESFEPFFVAYPVEQHKENIFRHPTITNEHNYYLLRSHLVIFTAQAKIMAVYSVLKPPLKWINIHEVTSLIGGDLNTIRDV